MPDARGGADFILKTEKPAMFYFVTYISVRTNKQKKLKCNIKKERKKSVLSIPKDQSHSHRPIRLFCHFHVFLTRQCPPLQERAPLRGSQRDGWGP